MINEGIVFTAQEAEREQSDNSKSYHVPPDLSPITSATATIVENPAEAPTATQVIVPAIGAEIERTFEAPAAVQAEIIQNVVLPTTQSEASQTVLNGVVPLVSTQFTPSVGVVDTIHSVLAVTGGNTMLYKQIVDPTLKNLRVVMFLTVGTWFIYPLLYRRRIN